MPGACGGATSPRTQPSMLPIYHPTQAVALRSANLRFDLCSKEGPPTTDLGALLTAAALPWQK